MALPAGRDRREAACVAVTGPFLDEASEMRPDGRALQWRSSQLPTQRAPNILTARLFRRLRS
jgi:hypothetical protein